VTTRHESEEFGTQLRMEGGEIMEQTRAGTPVGTIINVEHIFFNMPARRKYLRKPATETGHITTVIQNYALAYPDRRFSLTNEGRLLFQSSGTGDLFDVLVKVRGLTKAKQMIPIGINPNQSQNEVELDGGLEEEVDFMAGETHQTLSTALRITGYTSLPTLTHSNRQQINLFVNRRYVEDRNLTYAVVQAYHTLLPVKRSPIAVIFIDIAPDEVDVNVHPQKTQVRFAQERKVFSEIQKRVRQAVVQHAQIPAMGVDGDGSINRAQPDGTAQSSGWTAPQSTFTPQSVPHQPPLDMFVPEPGPPPPIDNLPPPPLPDEPPPIAYSEESLPLPPENVQSAQVPEPDSPEPTTSEIYSSENRSSEVVRPHTPQLPPLRVVGQAGTMYIVAEGPEGLYLIDQHAAHERILYEKFMAQRYGSLESSQLPESKVPRQQLLDPLTLHTGSELAGLVAQYLDALNHLGFDVEPFGGDTFLVRAVPAVLSGQDPLRNLEEIVQGMAERRNLVGEELEDRLVKMICKRASIKGGQQLSDIEMVELVRQLEECQSPRTCPHGRPTMIQLSSGELEKAFGRT